MVQDILYITGEVCAILNNTIMKENKILAYPTLLLLIPLVPTYTTVMLNLFSVISCLFSVFLSVVLGV